MSADTVARNEAERENPSETLSKKRKEGKERKENQYTVLLQATKVMKNK
jgi:hypothetical protein